MALVKASPGDEGRLRDWLAREPYFNLFLIANLCDGLGENLEVWEQPGVGLLQRHGRAWTLDAGPRPEEFDFAGAACVVASYPPSQVRSFVGRPEAIDPLVDRLSGSRGTVYVQRFAVMRVAPEPIRPAGTPRPARLSDLDALAEIYADAEDLSRPRSAVAEQLSRTWLVEDNGQITAVAARSAQTDRAAMIGGVFTPPEHRRKGYGSTVVHALAASILEEGRAACLFYHNPEAGRIYLRLGFQELGDWKMVIF